MVYFEQEGETGSNAFLEQILFPIFLSPAKTREVCQDAEQRSI
jgi:hypothetical protein